MKTIFLVIAIFFISLGLLVPQAFAEEFKPIVQITKMEFLDTFGNAIDQALLGQYPGVKTWWSYDVDSEQDYLVIMQVKNEKGFVEFLETSQVTLRPERHFDPSFTFFPKIEGNYTVTVFVWNSLEKPIPVSYPISNSINIQKTNCDVHPLSDSKYRDHLVPTKSLMMSPEDLAQLLVSFMDDEITDTLEGTNEQTVFKTLKGSMIINNDPLASPKAEYVITKNHSFDDEKYQERDGFREFVEYMGYEMYGVERWVSIGYPEDRKMYLSQLILGYDGGQSHSTKFFWSPDEIKIELDRWYQNASCLEFNVTEDDAKRIAYDYIESESKKDPQMIKRGIEPSIPERISLRIIDDIPAYMLTAGIGSDHRPNQDSPNCVWVMVDVFTGKVLGWEFCFFNI